MRIVIKLGTSSITYPTGRLNIRRTEKICKVVSDLISSGHEVILVSSGAIAMGMGKLSLKSKPADVVARQALAAIGQSELMAVYDRFFSTYGYVVGQILLSGEDFSVEDRREHFSNTLEKVLDFGAVPVINENDTLAVDEIKVGDNDTLSALVATCIGADLLVILSDVKGLYDGDPRRDKNAKIIKDVDKLTDETRALAGDSGTALGTGGMITKLHAAAICENKCKMVIASSADPDILYDIAEGKDGEYTRFFCKVK
jgi:glutamate 5-kinase